MLHRRDVFTLLLLVMLLVVPCLPFAAAQAKAPQGEIVQAQVVLTVSEGKRLIAKSIPRLPIVKAALEDGMVIICKGTTNTYVAEELVKKEIEHGAYVYGRTYPEKNGKKLPKVEVINEYILVNGKVQRDLTLDEAVTKLKPGDIVIKGANALDYQNQLAGVCVGGTGGGTVGKFIPWQVATKAHLVIPVGLEKQVSGDMMDIVDNMQQPIESLTYMPSMMLLRGHITTEIEAIKTFADVEAFQAAAGGIGGAEGAVRLVCRGSKSEVQKVLDLVATIHGEPPFVKE